MEGPIANENDVATPASMQEEPEWTEALLNRLLHLTYDGVAIEDIAIRLGRDVESCKKAFEGTLKRASSAASPSLLPKIPEEGQRNYSTGKILLPHFTSQDEWVTVRPLDICIFSVNTGIIVGQVLAIERDPLTTQVEYTVRVLMEPERFGMAGPSRTLIATNCLTYLYPERCRHYIHATMCGRDIFPNRDVSQAFLWNIVSYQTSMYGVLGRIQSREVKDFDEYLTLLPEILRDNSLIYHYPKEIAVRPMKRTPCVHDLRTLLRGKGKDGEEEDEGKLPRKLSLVFSLCDIIDTFAGTDGCCDSPCGSDDEEGDGEDENDDGRDEERLGDELATFLRKRLKRTRI